MSSTDQPVRGKSASPTRFDRAVPERDLLARLRTEWDVRDLVVLALVPTVLLAVYALPPEVRRGFALDHAAPTLLTAFTSHFVHLSSAHLLANLAGYLLVVPTGYALAVASGRRRQFFVVFAAFLGSLPLLLSGLNLLFPRPTVGVGFSGVLLAFVGYLPFAFMSFIGSTFDVDVDAGQSHWLFFFGLGVVAYVAAPGVYGLGLAAAATLAGVLYLLPVVETVDRTQVASWRSTLAVSGYGELVLLGTALFFIYPFVAFPTDFVVASGVINVYTHALGFCLGYITTYVTALGGWLDVD